MSASIFMMQDYRCFLSQVLVERCMRNKNYSLRALARDLGIAPSQLSLLINRKSSLSLERAQKISNSLSLTQPEQDYFVALVEKEKYGRGERALELRQAYAFEQVDPDECLNGGLSLEDFAVLLNLGLLGGARSLDEAASRMSLDSSTMEACLARLQNLGWIEWNDSKGWAAMRGLVRTEAYSRSASIRIFHQKVLELGLKQLHEGEVHERFFHSLIFSLNHKEYEDFSQELRAFCLKKCDAYSSRDSHDKIYTLGIQLLPIASLNRGECAII